MGQNRTRDPINVVRRFDPFLGRWVGVPTKQPTWQYQPDEELNVSLGVSEKQASAILEGRRPLRGRRLG